MSRIRTLLFATICLTYPVAMLELSVVDVEQTFGDEYDLYVGARAIEVSKSLAELDIVPVGITTTMCPRSIDATYQRRTGIFRPPGGPPNITHFVSVRI